MMVQPVYFFFLILGTAKGGIVGGVAVFVWANAGCLLGQLFFLFLFLFFLFLRPFPHEGYGR